MLPRAINARHDGLLRIPIRSTAKPRHLMTLADNIHHKINNPDTITLSRVKNTTPGYNAAVRHEEIKDGEQPNYILASTSGGGFFGSEYKKLGGQQKVFPVGVHSADPSKELITPISEAPTDFDPMTGQPILTPKDMAIDAAVHNKSGGTTFGSLRINNAFKNTSQLFRQQTIAGMDSLSKRR